MLCYARWSRASVFETQGATGNRTRDVQKKELNLSCPPCVAENMRHCNLCVQKVVYLPPGGSFGSSPGWPGGTTLQLPRNHAGRMHGKLL